MITLAQCCCNGCSCSDPLKMMAVMLLIQLIMAVIVAIAVLIKETDK